MSGWINGARSRLVRASLGGVASGIMAILVVLVMVAAAAFWRQSADRHRRAQVVAEQLRASTQELSALKWRGDTEALLGTADLSPTGPLRTDGLRIVAQLKAELSELRRLAPGAETQQLQRDVQQFQATGARQLSFAGGRGRLAGALLNQMQKAFQPVLDRMDRDARRAAQHQQSSAAGVMQRSVIGSIGSLLLGVGALAALAWRHARLRRRNVLSEKIREIERRSEQRMLALLEHSSDVVTVLGEDLRVRWQASSVTRLLGLEPGSLTGAPILSVVNPEDQSRYEESLLASLASGTPITIRARLRHADGRWCEVETVAESQLDDPDVAGLVLNMRDISERKAFEDELRRQAFHDSLTGLANRALFDDRLRHGLASGLRTGRQVAVLFLDLDDFKTINDSLGHRVGDNLLNGVAARIDSLVRPSDTAARLGGDEFAVLLEGVDNEDEAKVIADRILQGLTSRFTIEEHELGVTASIGIAISDGSIEADEILRNADMAMYAAKANGKNSVHAFEQQMHFRAVERLELRSELRRALSRGEFELEYQPIVALDGARIVGVEALVRWAHPGRGRLAPEQFIGIAEETGAIVPLGLWVLENACAQVSQWNSVLAEPERLYVTVNVSIRQLRDENFPASVADVLARTGTGPEWLILEITEGLLADDREAISRRLHALKQLGVRIAVDDFGTGYSALSHLQHFPVDILKIDKSFIDGLQGDPQNANLVRGIIDLGRSLHLEVIAEGVEQPHQAEELKAMQSILGQGFLFSRPVSADAVLALVRDSSAAKLGADPA